MLKVNNLAFSYNGRSVLSDISFEVSSGRIVALMGANGSGKTTLLRCLDLFLKPERGTIFLNGKSLESMTSAQLARRIAYMPQRCGIAGLTVFDSVLLGRKPYFSWSPSQKDLDLVESTLQRLNLLDKAFITLDRLSGGELQKASLARVFVQEPVLLLLDEPTSALDLKNRMEIMTILREFIREKNVTVLLSIHDLNDALRLADRFLFLHEGKILADETSFSLSESVLNRVYGVPLELHTVSRSRMVIPKGIL